MVNGSCSHEPMTGVLNYLRRVTRSMYEGSKNKEKPTDASIVRSMVLLLNLDFLPEELLIDSDSSELILVTPYA